MFGFGRARIPNIQTTNIGDGLRGLLNAGDIATAHGLDYQLCKDIYILHPLGQKMADKPIELAQSQRRELNVQGAGTAAEQVRDRFEEIWVKHHFDELTANTVSVSRVYGAGAVGVLQKGISSSKPLDVKNIWKTDFAFNVYDPLNVAGSLVLNQNPLSREFLHVSEMSVNGESFHRSRSRVLFNERPIYIWYVTSGFGYTGRSVYQRPLLPMKSFITTMVTDDLVSRKAGVIVAKIKAASTVVNNAIKTANANKRGVVQVAEVGNVINIGIDEAIESIDLKNLSEPYNTARKNIIENCASGAGMPALLLNEESLGGSFHEGSEDARVISRYIDRFRDQTLDPIYNWLDPICMRLAWTPAWYETFQKQNAGEFGDVDFEVFFWRCANSFRKKWPSLLQEPESDQVEVEKVKLEAIIKFVEVLLPNVPQEQKADVLMWATDKFNSLPLLFGGGDLQIDWDAVAAYESSEMQMQAEPKSGNLSFGHDARESFMQSLLAMVEKHHREREKRMRLVK